MASTTMSTAQKKWTSLAELEQKTTGPVWVMNTTEQQGEAAQILISVPKINGTGVDVVRIPRTFIAVDLTQQVPRLQLLNSAEFRKSVQKQLIKLCSEAYAKAILSTADGKAEQRRIENALLRAQVAADNANVAGNTDEDDEDEYFNPEEMEAEGKAGRAKISKTEEAKVQRDVQNDVNMRLQNMAANAIGENHTEQQIRSELRNYGKPMNSAEFKFLASKFKDKPKVMSLLKEMATKQKAKAKG